jgi:hypothetical protein
MLLGAAAGNLHAARGGLAGVRLGTLTFPGYRYYSLKPENSYRVTLERGRLRWTTSDGGTVRVYTTEPETSWWQRFRADAPGILPIHSIL